MHQDPHWFAQARTRWTLRTLPAACPWLLGLSPSGIWQWLRRWHLPYKRGRGHLHSPDPDYRAKLADIRAILALSQSDPTRDVVVFADEMGIYRQPTLAQAYEQAGKAQPVAELGYSTNRCVRVAAAVNVWTGQVTYRMRAKVTGMALIGFLQALRADYPEAERIYVIWDNWPLHFHPDVLAALQAQAWAYPLHTPGNWPTKARRKAKRLDLPIRLVPLPTYAPWTNPIEKLWRWLRQEELHLHRFGDNWVGLKQCIGQFLDRFAQGSEALLRYVGLSDPHRLYQAALQLPDNRTLARC